MSNYDAERVSPTEWKIDVDCGGWNSSIEVVAFAEGIKVDYQLITWDELADARQFFTMKERHDE